jgi:hypothetical protein
MKTSFVHFKDRSAIYLVKKKIMKNIPVQAIFTGKIFYMLKSMNSIVRVGDGDGLYGEQWNLSGDRRVSIVLRDLSPRPLVALFNRFIPSVFHKTQNIHQKTPLKCIFSI